MEIVLHYNCQPFSSRLLYCLHESSYGLT